MLGLFLIDYMTQERYLTEKVSERMQAHYAAEAGVQKAAVQLRELFSQKLLSDKGEVNRDFLRLLDIDKAQDFSFKTFIKQNELLPDTEAEVIVTLSALRPTPFYANINRFEQIPTELQTFYESPQGEDKGKALGGWEGILVYTSTGKYKKTEKTIQVAKEIKVTDLTAPADEYTLFISGHKDEFLKEGEFRCKNWSVVRELYEMVTKLAQQTNKAFKSVLGNTATDFFWEPSVASNVSFEGEVKMKTLGIIRDFVLSVSDGDIKDYVDMTIQELKPHNWGKVRTNGRLHVFLPFFAADDIINYFEDKNVFSHQRPEIGFLFCSNQLHDPYLSKYSYYEGDIIRYYQKLKPYVLGVTETPYPSSESYTLNTKHDFVAENPDLLEPPKFKRIFKDAKDYCHEFYDKELTVAGTYSKPATLWGLKYVQGPLNIGGRISGQCMIVCEGDINVTSDILHDNANSYLALVSLNGKVKLKPSLKKAKIEAAIYAKNSIVGNESINVFGNLAVENLNRQDGESGPLLMPKHVILEYDFNLRSRVANNITFNISDIIVTQRSGSNL